MTRWRFPLVGFVATSLLLVCSPPARAKEPAQILAEKGLVKQGQYYVAQSDADLNETVKQVKALKKKMDDETRQRQSTEKQINDAKAYIANLELDRKRGTDAVNAARTRNEQEKLIAQLKELEGEMERVASAKANLEQKLRKIGEQTKQDYVNLVVKAGEQADKAEADYKTIEADTEVKAAINQLAATKVKLGPAPEFTANVAQVKKWRGDVNSVVIPIRMEGNTPQVEVTLNGTVTRTMTVDSGAGIVSVPADLAEDLNLHPTEKDPVMRMLMADGRAVEGRRMKLKSVKVGVFTVEDVDCVVLPKQAVAATPLLGGTFLSNFVFRVDPKAGELHLAQVAGGNPNVKVGAETGRPAAGTKEPVQPATGGSGTGAATGTNTKPPPAGNAGTGSDDRIPGAPGTGGSGTGASGTGGAGTGTGSSPKPATPTPRPAAGTTDNGNDTAADPSPATGTPSAPTTPTKETPVPPSGDSKKLLAYLESEYKKKLESPDWRQRAMATISLARLPHNEVTEKLMLLIDQDRHDVVRLIAWQAILSRAPELSSGQHTKFVNASLNLAERGAFKGQLRVALFDVLGTAPMSSRSRKVFEKHFMETNAWMTNDIPTLRAMGRCLASWKSGQLADWLVGRMNDQSIAYRAEFVLQNSGVKVPSVRDRLAPEVMNPQSKERSHVSSDQLWQTAQADYAAYLKANRKQWTEVRSMSDVQPPPVKQLRPLYVPPPVTLSDLESNAELWKADLELGKTNLKSFEVAFVVDATGSMQEVLDWLSQDVVKMMAALAAASLEPRIGITFYRDQGDEFVTKSVPLTKSGKDLVAAVKETPAVGGGQDVDEAVLAGLQEAITKNRWNASQDGGKVVILIGDAPPHPKEIKASVDVAAEARKKGFKVYAGKVTTASGANDLDSFDQIAAAGGGTSVGVEFRALSRNKFLTQKGTEIPLPTIDRPEAQVTIAPNPVNDNVGDAILKGIIADAINPQYRDRLDPLVRTLLAWSEQPSPPEKRLPFPANTPPLIEGKWRPQG